MKKIKMVNKASNITGQVNVDLWCCDDDAEEWGIVNGGTWNVINNSATFQEIVNTVTGIDGPFLENLVSLGWPTVSQCFRRKGIILDMIGVGQQYLPFKIIYKEQLSLTPCSLEKCAAKGSFLLYIWVYKSLQHHISVCHSALRLILPAAVRKSVYLGLHWIWVSKLHCTTITEDI